MTATDFSNTFFTYPQDMNATQKLMKSTMKGSQT